MLLLHGEGILFDALLKLLGAAAPVALVIYVAWDAVNWGRRN
jgi:hypothetical protein